MARAKKYATQSVRNVSSVWSALCSSTASVAEDVAGAVDVNG